MTMKTYTTNHQPIPGSPKYEINESGKIRNVKHKGPVFANAAGEVLVTNSEGERVSVDVKKLVKELFNKDLKPETKTKLEKETMKKEKSQPKEAKVKVKVEKVKKEKAPKPAKVAAISTVNKSIKEGDSITFSPRWKKHRTEGEAEVSGVIKKIFIAPDKNEYLKIQVATPTGTKTYLKQTKNLQV